MLHDESASDLLHLFANLTNLHSITIEDSEFNVPLSLVTLIAHKNTNVQNLLIRDKTICQDQNVARFDFQSIFAEAIANSVKKIAISPWGFSMQEEDNGCRLYYYARGGGNSLH